MLARDRNEAAPHGLAILGCRQAQHERCNLGVSEQEQVALVQVQTSRQPKQQGMRRTSFAGLDKSNVRSCYSCAKPQFALR
jgi:hypothetical protein